jgi:flagellar biosynthesis/type III secretory pathway chaperone
VEKNLAAVHRILQKLIGLHRQMLDAVRTERSALAGADVRTLQESVHAKEALVESIRQLESERLRVMTDLALALRVPLKDLTLSRLAIEVQGGDLKAADQLRSARNALVQLAERIREQNEYNRGWVEQSLAHVNQMKRNVLGESKPASDTYTARGARQGGAGQSKLISKEA